jgi:hypothetical protein
MLFLKYGVDPTQGDSTGRDSFYWLKEYSLTGRNVERRELFRLIWSRYVILKIYEAMNKKSRSFFAIFKGRFHDFPRILFSYF